MPTHRIPYTAPNGFFKPYLRAVFVYNNKHTPATIGLMDSGADFTLVPYSLGLQLGFPEKGEDEQLLGGNGVAGTLNYLERNCWIYMLDHKKKDILGFREKVGWVYPNDSLKKTLEDNRADYQANDRLQKQCLLDTALWHHFENAKEEVIKRRKELNQLLETDVLFGRTFFHNFKYVQFFQKDRATEESCHFNFEVDPAKIGEIVPRTPKQLATPKAEWSK